MNELIVRLTLAGQQHKNTDLGGLLQWAALHIQNQDEALVEIRAELQMEHSERIQMEQTIYTVKDQMQAFIADVIDSLPVNIKLEKDHAPHINVMAFHGIEPYAKKGRKK